MKCLEAYDVVQVIQVYMNEVLGDDILDDKDIDINYDVFIDEEKLRVFKN